MAYYTIIAATQKQPTRACWMLDAHSADAALRAAWTLREQGEMPWLPPTAILSVRKSSRIERTNLAAAMRAKPTGGPLTGSDETARRARRVAAAFFSKLWNGTA